MIFRSLFSSLYFCRKEPLMKENQYQARLIKKLRAMYPTAIILKNDSGYLQGIADLLILKDEHWAALECKRSKDAEHRPNQDYYIDKMDRMSFARFIYPENEREVLYELQQTFGSGG